MLHCFISQRFCPRSLKRWEHWLFPGNSSTFPWPMLLLSLKSLTSFVRIFCSFCTVTCRVRLAQLFFGTLFPITAKLLVKKPSWRTQQPAVHNELGTNIFPLIMVSIGNLVTRALYDCTLFWCSWILAKEVPVKRYNFPAGWPNCGFVHVLAYFLIFFSKLDHWPLLKDESCGTVFV